MIVLVSTFEGKLGPPLIFTNRKALLNAIAKQFITYLEDTLHDESSDEMEVNSYCFATYLNNYEVVRCEVNEKLPIFVMQTLDFVCLRECITQDLEEWKKVVPERAQQSEGFLRDCTYVWNPQKQEFLTVGKRVENEE